MFKHKHISKIERLIEISKQGAWDHVFEITTTLELDGTAPDFNQSELDTVLKAFAEWSQQENQHWDRLNLRSE